MNEIRVRFMYDDLTEDEILSFYSYNTMIITTIKKGEITAFEKDGFEYHSGILTGYIMYDMIGCCEIEELGN